MTALVRAAVDSDAEGLIALIGACWAEYDGCILDVDGEVPELRAIATHYADRGGEFWVAEDRRRVVASIGWLPSDAGVELCKLYVDASQRRRGLGGRLVALVEEAALRRGVGEVELWSDTRFHDAHRLYAQAGYVREPGARFLADLSDTYEYHFRKRLPVP